jgi:hypothetical protein
LVLGTILSYDCEVDLKLFYLGIFIFPNIVDYYKKLKMGNCANKRQELLDKKFLETYNLKTGHP